MKTTVNFYDFRNAFQQISPNNFSYEGLSILWDYLTELEAQTEDNEIELDVIAFCCDFVESKIDDIVKDYSIEIDPTKNKFFQVMEYLENKTIILGYFEDESSIVYQVF